MWPPTRYALWHRDNFSCAYCKKQLGEDGVEWLTVDHVRPGQDNDLSNLVTACNACNDAKNNKTLKQFFHYLKKNDKSTDGIKERIERLTSKEIDRAFGRRLNEKLKELPVKRRKDALRKWVREHCS